MAPESDLVQDEEGFVPVREMETGGVLTDEEGNKWAVPADNVLDWSDMGKANPLSFPLDLIDPQTSYGRKGGKHDGFYFQWVRLDQWDEYRSLKFVRVKVREMHAFTELEREYGKSTGGEFIEFCGMIAVKCPIFIKEQIEAKKEADRRLALEGTEAVEQTVQGGARGSIVERTTRTTAISDEPPTAPRRVGKRDKR